MAGFDQVRHPMRFAVATSTMSGLLVVLLTAFLERISRSWGAWHSSLVLLLVPGYALAALPLVLWTSRARRKPRVPPRVFMIVAAFTQKQWVAELIRDLHETLERRGYDMVLKIPDRDFSGVSQVRLLDGILRRRTEYAGGFIMVNQAEDIHEDLARFCDKAEMPIVFVDAEPFKSEDAYPPGTAFVGCDDGKIGSAAATWIADYFRRERIKRPVVLVINGGHYPRRERMFQETLESEIHDVQIVADCANFDRAQAREAARTQLRKLHAGGKRLHAVFCTNDEMALGVTDAFLFADVPWARTTVVVGVDGTPQARAMIEAGPSPLQATVIQDSYKVAETAVSTLQRMIQHEPVPRRTTVPAEIFARD